MELEEYQSKSEESEEESEENSRSEIRRKRNRRSRSPSPYIPDPNEEIYAVFELIRQSAKCNMITEPNCFFTALVCTLAFLKLFRSRDRVFEAMRNHTHLDLYDGWVKNHRKKAGYWINMVAAIPPYGKDFIDAFKANAHMRNVEPSKELTDFIDWMEYNQFGWQKAIITKAEEVCLARGIVLRDRVRIDRLRGETNEQQLKYAGAESLY